MVKFLVTFGAARIGNFGQHFFKISSITANKNTIEKKTLKFYQSEMQHESFFLEKHQYP
jgi:hypothetical protein